MPRVILAAAGSGSGKTTITCGLLQALLNAKKSVHAYKCGPDYIDPMFHSKVIGVPSENLDTYFSDKEDLLEILSYGEDMDLTLIEGAMGIYDGLSIDNNNGSAYDLACQTNTPIVLIMDVAKMGQTMISLIKGILGDDKEHLIKGLILNRISPSYYRTMKPLIEEKTGITVVGFVEKQKDFQLESRHLGLKLPEEVEDMKAQVMALGKSVEATIDLESLLEIGKLAQRIQQKPKAEKLQNVDSRDGLTLGVAKDEAFCFLYPANIRILESLGVEICYFSPLRDEGLPEKVDGLLLPGGYPELWLKELENNTSMRESIRSAIKAGMPCLAECGGFMYLHENIEDQNGKAYEMVGIIPGKCFNTGKLCRFGYVEVEGFGMRIKGHEFHYFDSTANLKDAIARKPNKDLKWEFGYANKGSLWGFPHLYYGSNKEFVENFVESMNSYKNKANHDEVVK